MTHSGNGFRTRRDFALPFTAALLVLALFAPAAKAGDRAPFQARAGIEAVTAAARVWASDASLVYLENDEDLAPAGASVRWGYLFYSPSRGKARAYSLRAGKIVVARDLAMKFDAPPVAPTWVDSDVALKAAEDHGGRDYCRAHAGRAGVMLLSRGAFQDGDPDPTTWTVVFTSAGAPSLFVLVDAAEGKVRRTWRG
jgi:hypothetical protein